MHAHKLSLGGGVTEFMWKGEVEQQITRERRLVDHLYSSEDSGPKIHGFTQSWLRQHIWAPDSWCSFCNLVIRQTGAKLGAKAKDI